VQGVGFRNFVQHAAHRIGVQGYTRNLDDGRVEVYAIGSDGQLSDLVGMLWKGPRWADVHGVDEVEASLESCQGFYILH
jgi:acylphosphatase